MAEEKKIEKAEKRLAKKKQRQQSPRYLSLGFLKIVGPIFWTTVIVTSIISVKSLLFYSAITDDLRVEIILKTMAIIIILFVVTIIYTVVTESEIWRRVKKFFTQLRFYEERPW